LRPTGLFQARINASRPTTLRQVAGYILEFTLLAALRTRFWRIGRLKGKAAIAALPEGFVFLWVHDIRLLIFAGMV
jgi:hypothetical protein